MAITEQLTWEVLEPKDWPVPRKAARLGGQLIEVLALGLYVAKGEGTYSYVVLALCTLSKCCTPLLDYTFESNSCKSAGSHSVHDSRTANTVPLKTLPWSSSVPARDSHINELPMPYNTSLDVLLIVDLKKSSC